MTSQDMTIKRKESSKKAELPGNLLPTSSQIKRGQKALVLPSTITTASVTSAPVIDPLTNARLREDWDANLKLKL